MPQKLRAVLALILALAPASTLAANKNYAALTYGFASVPEEEGNISAVKGSAFGFTFGHMLQKNFALEGVGQYMSFGEKSATDQGVTSTTSQAKYLLAGGGRFFLGKYFNIHAGLGVGKVDFTFANSVSSSSAASDSRYMAIIYYGGGAQYPLGNSLELMADYTLIGAGMSVTEINLGLRLRL